MLDYTYIFKLKTLIKFYHWECVGKRGAYNMHKLLDEQLEDIDETLDEFVETYLGIKPDSVRRFDSTPGYSIPGNDLSQMGAHIIKVAKDLAIHLQKISAGNSILESQYQNVGAALAKLKYLLPQCY